MSNQKLAEKLDKPIIRKSKKWKVYAFFKVNILHADSADTQLTSKYIKGIWFLLCVIHVFSKYSWVVSLKDKKGTKITFVVRKMLDESTINEWNHVEIYSTHNEGKSVTAERFIRTLKSKIYKYITAISKTAHIDNKMI